MVQQSQLTVQRFRTDVCKATNTWNLHQTTASTMAAALETQPDSPCQENSSIRAVLKTCLYLQFEHVQTKGVIFLEDSVTSTCSFPLFSIVFHCFPLFSLCTLSEGTWTAADNTSQILIYPHIISHQSSHILVRALYHPASS